MTELLEARAVTKTHRMGSVQVTALHALSLAVREGELIAIQGASGSEKSTLLNLIGGLDRPTSGDILFDGKSIEPFDKKQLAQYRRYSVGMIFQNFNLIPKMTAIENVKLALAFGGIRRGERDRRAQALLARLGLADRITRTGRQSCPGASSSGWRLLALWQRTRAFRWLTSRPEILIRPAPGNCSDCCGNRLRGLLPTSNLY